MYGQNRTNMVTKAAMKAKLLDPETELALARAWRDDRDEKALHRLTMAYMRLAISMAMRFKRYGVPVADLIQEAGVGLMKAADRFDPDRGVRFSTYAVWWIRASIQDHVMRNWSLVRTGSTSAQKSLFFNLRRVEAELERDARKANEDLDSHQLSKRVATEIGVSLADVCMMQGRLSGGDFSLNALQNSDDEGREWIDVLEDDAPEGAESFADSNDQEQAKLWIQEAIENLTDREKLIIQRRKLTDDVETLETLGKDLGISKERVRQLESAALGKMRRALECHAPELRQLLTEQA